MSVKRAILAGQLLTRESGKSCLAANGLHIRRDHRSELLPAQHLGEVWVERNGVMQRKREEREDIFHKHNCAWLTANQNGAFVIDLKHEARYYLLDLYGEKAIDEWLESIDWPERVRNLLP